MNQPVIQNHLNEILVEAANEFDCHVQLATWIAQAEDERLVTFFGEFQNVPALPKLPSLFNRLLAQPNALETGLWLEAFCRASAIDPPPHLRRWHLLAAAWYATCFNPGEGLAYLQAISNDAETLSPEDNEILTNAANEINGMTAMIQWIAACPNPEIKAMLVDFGHPDLAALAHTILLTPADYEQLAGAKDQAAVDAQIFQRNVALLKDASVALNRVETLDLACGLLAPQALLFNSAGYRTTGVDLHVPPAYLPVSSFKLRLKRWQHSRAWKKATAAYYRALGREAGLKLKWSNIKIEQADLTRLHLLSGTFGVVGCNNFLQHAPDVAGLLAEVARVLQPGGLILADVLPYPALTGAFQTVDDQSPWEHLRHPFSDPSLPLNQWREGQYQTAFEKYFTIEQWLIGQDEQAEALLTPEIQAELAEFSPEELTRQEIVILARKKN
jgi:SAM-dependent methyltransferase